MKYKKIHFVGIKGVGMAPLAIIAKQAGCIVTGCDVGDSFITDTQLHQSGITPEIGFHPDHLKDVDLVITTGAHGGYDNQEIKTAKEKNIPLLTQGQAVGEFMKGTLFDHNFVGISIAGCHGKTTTTAMVATIFQEAGKDPSYIIGTGYVPSLKGAGHFGEGEFFIAEADEYATEPQYDKTAKFLWQYPTYAVITNIEFDHPDIYPSIVEVRRAYELFLNNVQKNGVLFVNGDDENTKKILENYSGKIIKFGLNSSNDYVLDTIQRDNDKTVFTIKKDQQTFGTFYIHSFGEHNVLNALAAILVSEAAGISQEEIQKGLDAFIGTQRRAEFKGKLPSGALVYDDYAHHPTEIKKTLMAFRTMYPAKHIVPIFQPHTFSRTKLLFDDFVYSFNEADTVIITDIYKSNREKADSDVSSENLVKAMKSNNQEVIYIPELQNVVKYIKENAFSEDTVLITMGAGDVYKISDQLMLNL